ncbi:hypothetical protein Trydic_g10618 [Trypoxylus dichotomus]
MRRTRGRPKFFKSGSRGRLRKIYQSIVEKANLIEESEFCFNSEASKKHAVAGTEAGEWLDAMVEEVKAILKNDAWELVARPSNQEVIAPVFSFTFKYA